MANEPRGAWAKPRSAASRTPQQSRSSNASPAPASAPSNAPPAAAPTTPAPAAPAANVWAQRAAAQKPSAVTPKAAKKEQSGSAVAAATSVAQEKHVPVNNFNESEVRQMMGQKEAASVYKVDMSASASDPANMANGKNFWAHLEEQVTAARQKDGEKQ